MPKGDELCPLGFAPHSIRPTRCKRCFRDYSEHNKKKDSDKSSKSSSENESKSSKAAVTEESQPAKRALKTSLSLNDDREGTKSSEPKIPEEKSETPTTTTVRRRRPIVEETLTVPSNDDTGSISPNGRRRTRQRPGSWSYFDNDKAVPSETEATSTSKPHDQDRMIVQGQSSPSVTRKTSSGRDFKPPLFDESTEATSPDVQFMLQVKTSHLNAQRSNVEKDAEDNEDMVSVAGTETTETTLMYQDSVEDLQSQVSSLKKQLADQCPSRTSTETEETIKKLKLRIFELETTNEDLRDERHVLQLETKEMQEQLDKRPPIENIQKMIMDLQQKLQASEAMCEELVEENEEYKREIQGLEDEMDEIQDNFREDQASQYMDIKKELEQTAKNCRILQFKLKKVERRSAQMESEKNAAEDQLKAVTNADNIDVDQIRRIQQLEAEIKASKEVTMKLTTEMDALQTKLRRAETERDALAQQKPGQKVLPISNEQSGRPHSPADDTSQLMRELYDTVEREKDTREQLKFSQEEAKSLRKRLSNLEDENEGLLLQIKKMASAAPKASRERRTISKEKPEDSDSGLSDGSEDQLSVSELKVHMELLEQEAKVLRKKLGEAEAENEGLNKEIKYLEGKVSEKLPQSQRLPPMTFPGKNTNNDVDLNYYEQRIKLLESESNELRRKLIDKERENEQLTNELDTASRRRGSKMPTPAVQRSRSLDSDSQQIDTKRQLQLMEQEVGILRQKANDMEAENERLSDENKRLQLKAGTSESGQLAGNKKPGPITTKLRERIAVLENEEKETAKRLHELEEENTNLKKSKLTKPTQKLPESNNVAELKAQIGKLEANIKTANTLSDTLKKEMEKVKSEMDNKVATAETEKRNLQKELTALSIKLNVETEKLNKADDEICTLKRKLTTAERNSEKVDKKREEQLQITAQTLNRKVETLGKELEEEKERYTQIRKRLDSGELVEFEQMRKVEQEKHKLQKESLENEKKMAELTKRIQDLEQSSKESNKVQRTLKRELEDTHLELETERTKIKKLESKQNETSIMNLKEKEDLKKQLSDAQNRIESSEEKLTEEKTRWKAKTEALENEINKCKNDWLEKVQRKDNELKSCKEQIAALKSQVSEAHEKLLTASRGIKGADEFEEKYRRLEANYKRDKDDWMDKEVNLESVLKTEAKRRERMEKDHEVEMRDRDEDMLRLKDKIKRLENEIKRIIDQRGNIDGELEDRVKMLENELGREKQEYDDLTSKYELLEEEYLVLKAHKVMEKEQVESNFNALKRNYDEIEGELKALRETFNVRQDTWIKEKLDLQEKVKELSTKLSRANVSTWDLERARLKDTIEEKQHLLDQVKKEDKVLKDEVERLKRQVDDTKKMLEDYNRVKAYGRNIGSGDTPNLTKEIEELKSKIQTEEKAHRSELSTIKMKSEQRLVLLQDEIHALHLQNAKFRREKDTFKEMLDGAQKSLGELKSDSVRKERSSHVYAQLDEARLKLETLRKEKEEVLDKLDLAERNCSKAKTEYMTEKASWEIKTATMQTKINELEETTILQGGRSKIFGVKTKLELAWQKEREEQHRLLTESHKMARDLKQRLLDIEAARDRERLESVRHLDQLRKTMDEEQTQLQVKIHELQNDLKELREAHAKVASTNDRVKRQKDRLEWEKEELLMISNETKQLHLQDKITIANLTDELRNLKSMVPAALGEGWDSTTAATRGQPAKADEAFKENFKMALKKISTAVEELRRVHGQKDEDKIKRNLSFRRAISEDEDESGQTRVADTTGTLGRRRDDPLGRWRNPQRVTNYPLSPPSMYISPPKRPQSLYRKTLSLDQSVNLDTMQSANSDNDGRGSNTSLSSQGVDGGPVPSPRLRRRQRGMVVQQSSIESDISNTSLESLEVGGGVSSSSDISRVQSVVSEGGRKKGFKEKLKKKLSKAKSIEGTPTADHIRQAGFQVLSPGLGSASSVGSEVSETAGSTKGSKDLKSRITKLFQKSGSKSGSLEKVNEEKKEVKSQTLNRPLMVNTKSTTSNSADVKRTGTLPRFGSVGNLNK